MAALSDTENELLLIASLQSRLTPAMVLVAGFATDGLVPCVLAGATLRGAGLLCTFFAVLLFCLLSCAELLLFCHFAGEPSFFKLDDPNSALRLNDDSLSKGSKL